MLKSIIILIVLSLCIGTAAWLFFIWAVRRGDFDDVEGPKYRMLDEDDEPADNNSIQRGENNGN